MYHDKVQFIPGMQDWFNIWKSINEIYYIDIIKSKKHMTFSIGTEKTFGKVQYLFMINNSMNKEYKGISSTW